MIRLILLLFVLLSPPAAIVYAQHTERDAIMESRFSIGMAGGFSLPFQRNDPSAGDPIHLTDNAIAQSSFACISSYRLTPWLALEFAVGSYLYSDETTISATHNKLFEEAYPGYLALEDFFFKPGLAAIGGGLSYGLRFDEFSIEPSLLACYAGVTPGYFYMLMKKQGENEYRKINHLTTQAGTFVLIPVVMLRYSFAEVGSRAGVLFRASYLHPRLDIDHNITETTLSGEHHTDQRTVQHTFNMLNFEIGAYYSLF